MNGEKWFIVAKPKYLREKFVVSYSCCIEKNQKNLLQSVN